MAAVCGLYWAARMLLRTEHFTSMISLGQEKKGDAIFAISDHMFLNCKKITQLHLNVIRMCSVMPTLSYGSWGIGTV